MSYIKILKECIKVAEERQGQYGEASESLDLCSEILLNTFGLNLTPEQICQVLISLKLSRANYKFKKDSLLDIINYIAIMIHCGVKKPSK